MDRLLKQILYGALFAAILSSAGFIIYKSAFSGACFGNRCVADCPTCGLSIMKENVYVSPLSPLNSSLAVKISNPSDSYGLKNFNYTFVVYGKFGPRLLQVRGESSLYPSEEKYLVESGINLNPEDIGQIDFQIGDLDWRKTSDLPIRPNLAILRENVFNEQNNVMIKGELINKSSNDLGRVKVVAVGLDENDNPYRFSAVALDGVSADQGYEFNIFLPGYKYRAVKLFAEIAPQ